MTNFNPCFNSVNYNDYNNVSNFSQLFEYNEDGDQAWSTQSDLYSLLLSEDNNLMILSNEELQSQNEEQHTPEIKEEQYSSEIKLNESLSLDFGQTFSSPSFFPAAEAYTGESFVGAVTENENEITPKIDLSNASTEAPEAYLKLKKNERMKQNGERNARNRLRKKKEMIELAGTIERLSKRLQFLTNENVELKTRRLSLLDTESFGNQAFSLISVESSSTFIPISSPMSETTFQNTIAALQTVKQTKKNRETSSLNLSPKERARLNLQRFRDKEKMEKMLKLEMTTKVANLELEILKLENENHLLTLSNNDENEFSIILNEEQPIRNEEQQNFEKLEKSAEELRLTFPLFVPLPRVQTEKSSKNGLTEKEENASSDILRLTFPVFTPLLGVQTGDFFQNSLTEKKEKISPTFEKLEKSAEELRLTFPIFTPLPTVPTGASFIREVTENENEISPKIDVSNALTEAPEAFQNGLTEKDEKTTPACHLINYSEKKEKATPKYRWINYFSAEEEKATSKYRWIDYFSAKEEKATSKYKCIDYSSIIASDTIKEERKKRNGESANRSRLRKKKK